MISFDLQQLVDHAVTEGSTRKCEPRPVFVDLRDVLDSEGLPLRLCMRVWCFEQSCTAPDLNDSRSVTLALNHKLVTRGEAMAWLHAICPQGRYEIVSFHDHTLASSSSEGPIRIGTVVEATRYLFSDR